MVNLNFIELVSYIYDQYMNSIDANETVSNSLEKILERISSTVLYHVGLW